MPQHETTIEIRIRSCRFCHKVLPHETMYCPLCLGRQNIIYVDKSK